MMALRTARAFTGRSHGRPFRGPLPRPARRRARQRRACRRLGAPSRGRSPDGAGHHARRPRRRRRPPLERHRPGRAGRPRGGADDLAAIILEPVPFSNLGGEEPDPEFLRALRELTWERGVLLIFDEVITGFRLGLGGAAAHFGFAPDLHCFGKAVGGGFPVGVFGGRRDVMEAVVTPRPGRPARGRDDLPVRDVLGCAAGDGGRPRDAARARATPTRSPSPTRAPRRSAPAGGRSSTSSDSPRRSPGMSSWLGLAFTDRPIRTRRDSITADRARARAFSLGLLLGGVYLAPSHPGFTSAAHTEEDVAPGPRRLGAGAAGDQVSNVKERLMAGWIPPAIGYIVILGAGGVTAKLALRTITWEQLVLWVPIAYIVFSAIARDLQAARRSRSASAAAGRRRPPFAASSALILFFYALTKGPASQVTPATSAYPVVTVIGSALFLSEKITLVRGIGTGARRRRRRAARRADGCSGSTAESRSSPAPRPGSAPPPHASSPRRARTSSPAGTRQTRTTSSRRGRRSRRPGRRCLVVEVDVSDTSSVDAMVGARRRGAGPARHRRRQRGHRPRRARRRSSTTSAGTRCSRSTSPASSAASARRCRT